MASIKKVELVQHESYNYDSLEENKDENNLEEMLDEMMERPAPRRIIKRIKPQVVGDVKANK